MAVDIDIGEVMQRIEVRVRGLKGQGARLWLAGKLIAIAGWIARVRVEIEIKDGPDEQSMAYALRRCIEVLDSMHPGQDKYWAARRLAARVLGELD